MIMIIPMEVQIYCLWFQFPPLVVPDIIIIFIQSKEYNDRSQKIGCIKY